LHFPNWRRVEDSNLRCLAAYRISSATH